MADISVKMGVSGISNFKSAMNQGKASVKALDAELKLNAAQYKASGDAETYMANKAKLLQQQITAQKQVVDAASQALAAMAKNGDTSSTAYQRMAAQVATAKAQLLGMQSQLSGVGSDAGTAASNVDQLGQNMATVAKNSSFDKVHQGISKITELAKGAITTVLNLAKAVADAQKDAAQWADEVITEATKNGIDVETYQQWSYAAQMTDTSIDTILAARKKLMAATSGTDHLEIGGKMVDVYDATTGKARDTLDIFWDTVDALSAMGDVQARDSMAMELFGKSYTDLLPLITAGRDAWDAAADAAPVVSEENVKALGEANDAFQTLEATAKATKLKALAALAPAFTEIANAFTSIFQQLNEYMATPEGQAAIEGLGQAITNLVTTFTTDIDFSAAFSALQDVIKKLSEALQWISENKDEVVNAVIAIGTALAGLKVADGVLQFVNGAANLKNLFGGSGSVPTGGTAPTSAPNLPSSATGSAAGGSKVASFFSGAGNIIIGAAPLIAAGAMVSWQFEANDLFTEAKAKRDAAMSDFEAATDLESAASELMQTYEELKPLFGMQSGSNAAQVQYIKDLYAMSDSERKEWYKNNGITQQTQDAIGSIFGDLDWGNMVDLGAYQDAIDMIMQDVMNAVTNSERAMAQSGMVNDNGNGEATVTEDNSVTVGSMSVTVQQVADVGDIRAIIESGLGSGDR